uniref:Uncharacterized protein n=1 Tax=Rhizophora mucronata TaxID=61149 RepID=A0A2P2P2A0_RHIMU
MLDYYLRKPTGQENPVVMLDNYSKMQQPQDTKGWSTIIRGMWQLEGSSTGLN